MRQTRNIVILGILVALAAVGAVAYAVLRTPAAATGPIQAIPLAQSEGDTAPSPPQPTTGADSAAPATTSVPAGTTAASGGMASSILAQIVPEESEARFVIDEVLNNAPKTVIGTTNQVAGELSVDPANPSNSQIGVIQVNARTLTTDSDFRNRAIKNQILNTDQYEFITFTPTALEGLPLGVSTDQSYTFQIVGDLTIRDVTQQVTFDVTATPVSDSRLEGLAQTTIRYADYGITIPRVPQVASVDEDVRLEIEFVAVPK